MATKWNWVEATAPFFKPIAEFTAADKVADLFRYGKKPEGILETAEVLTFPFYFSPVGAGVKAGVKVGGNMIGGINRVASKSIPIIADVGKTVFGFFKSPVVGKGLAYGVGLGAAGIGLGAGVKAVAEPTTRALSEVGLVGERSTAQIEADTRNISAKKEFVNAVQNLADRINESRARDVKGENELNALINRIYEQSYGSQGLIENDIIRKFLTGNGWRYKEPIYIEDKRNTLFGIDLNVVLLLGMMGILGFVLVKRGAK